MSDRDELLRRLEALERRLDEDRETQELRIDSHREELEEGRRELMDCIDSLRGRVHSMQARVAVLEGHARNAHQSMAHVESRVAQVERIARLEQGPAA